MGRKKLKNLHLPIARLVYFNMKLSTFVFKILCLFTKYRYIGTYNNALFREKGKPMYRANGEVIPENFEYKINMSWYREQRDVKLRTVLLNTVAASLVPYMKSHPEFFEDG